MFESIPDSNNICYDTVNVIYMKYSASIWPVSVRKTVKLILF